MNLASYTKMVNDFAKLKDISNDKAAEIILGTISDFEDMIKNELAKK